VEDVRRAVAAEDLGHPLALLAVGQDRRDRGRVNVAVLLELALDLEEVVLGVVDQHEHAGSHAGDLAAELGADGAAGAGDHHHLAAEVGADAVDVHPDRLAAQDILHLDVTHLADDLAGAGLQELEDRGQRAHGNTTVAAGLDDLGPYGAGGRGDGDHDLVGL
jgi:hypothetical protein